MPSKNREKLRSFFKNKNQLSEAHFAALIDAMLDRKDDQFHGVWQAGRAYQPGDVVIYQRQLWEMSEEFEICAKPGEEPSDDDPSWTSFIDDNDWAVVEDEGVMWAKVFDKVGIGIGSDAGDRPQARLDVHKAETGRWLLFPALATHTQQTFLHYLPTAAGDAAPPPQTSALITGLSADAATWTSHTTEGFAFRHSSSPLDETAALQRSAADGSLMMVLRPSADNDRLATLGLNVSAPAAAIDVSDRQGQLHLLPAAATTPTLALLNLDSGSERDLDRGSDADYPQYFSASIDARETAWHTNANDGFVFRASGDYEASENTSESAPSTNYSLVRILQHPDERHPQVGIGTDSPAAYLDVHDQPEDSRRTQHQIQLLPTQALSPNPNPTSLPILAISRQPQDHTPTTLHTGIGKQLAGWSTNAEQGFVFRQHSHTDPLLSSNPITAEDLIMVIRPSVERPQLATLGLNVDVPTALVDAVGHHGQVQLLPPFESDPTLTLSTLASDHLLNNSSDEQADQPPAYLSFAINERQATWHTNANSGFNFSIEPKVEPENTSENGPENTSENGPENKPENTPQAASQPNNSTALVRIRQHPDGHHAQLGIGTQQPGAYLEANSDVHHIQLLPIQSLPNAEPITLPTVSIVSQPAGKPPASLHTGLGEDCAGWVTDAAHGFVFRQTQASGSPYLPTVDQGQAHLAIRENGRIGIGTQQPKALVEIHSPQKAGRFLFDFSPGPIDQATNPALAIVNHKTTYLEADENTYFTLGNQGHQGVLLTDAPEGFTFKSGEPTTDLDSHTGRGSTGGKHLDLDHGRLLVNISPTDNGQLGIGKQPDAYALDVQGMAQAFTFYQPTNSTWITCDQPLGSALRKIDCLRPITFKWSEASGFQPGVQQIGFRAQEVNSVFPQVVHTDSEGGQSVAYQNLVPVLVQAINELNKKNQKEHEQIREAINQLGDRYTVLVAAVLIGWAIALLGPFLGLLGQGG